VVSAEPGYDGADGREADLAREVQRPFRANDLLTFGDTLFRMGQEPKESAIVGSSVPTLGARPCEYGEGIGRRSERSLLVNSTRATTGSRG
jgi:hypothetical protein